MSDIKEEAPKPYMTYRGLGYTPMFAGIPLFAALGLVGGAVLAVIFAVLGSVILALVLVVVLMEVFFGLKVLCENNNKAPKMFILKLQGMLARITHGKISKVDLGVESNEQRKRFRQQFKCLFGFKQANS
jgi:type IV secretory pathway VirB3-like protein